MSYLLCEEITPNGVYNNPDNVSEIAYDFIINQLGETRFWNTKFLNIRE